MERNQGRRYRARLELLSAVSGPIQGDSIFGLVCCDIAMREGEKAVETFLNDVESGNRVFVVSDAFPSGCLPLPLFDPALLRAEPLNQNTKTETETRPRRSSKTVLVKPKTAESTLSVKTPPNTAEPFNFSLLKYIPADLLLKPSGPLGLETLRAAMESSELVFFSGDFFQASSRIRSSVDRLTGGAPEAAGPFSSEEYWLKAKTASSKTELDLYLVASEDGETIRIMLERALEAGYGAGRTAGRGQLIIRDLEPIDFPQAGKRRLALANFVPGQDDELSELRAQTLTKYGKVSVDLARDGNPFKKPILMFRSGANYKPSAEERDKTHIGRLLANIHSDSAIRHHAFAPVIAYDEA